MRITVSCLVCLILCAGVLRGNAGRTPQGEPGVKLSYTAAQAERGQVAYDENCSQCHGPALRGGSNDTAAPAIAGPFFFEKWSGRPVEEFFGFMSTTMPPEQNKLTPEAYVDVMAYIIQVWKYPAGSTELSATSLAMKQAIKTVE